MAVGTSSACLAVAGLPCLPAGRQPDKQEKELTTIILSNGNKSEVSIVF